VDDGAVTVLFSAKITAKSGQCRESLAAVRFV